jgi:hypothetical protein
MILHRVVKWAAAGVLALGAIPAIGLARLPQASLPTSGITVTPTSFDAMAPKKSSVSHVSHLHAAKTVKASLRSHGVKHHTVARSKSGKTASTRHHLKTGASHRVHSLHSKTASHHVRRTSMHQTHKVAAKTTRHA